MKCVTTCHQAGFAQYGHRLAESLGRLPAQWEWFTEGEFQVPCAARRLEEIAPLADLKRKHATYVPPNYMFDVTRFANKVYAAAEGLREHRGVGVWVDADCVIHKDVPAGFIEGLLDGAYLAMFRRPGLYTETGFWVMDCSHPAHRDFLRTWTDWYETGSFRSLDAWTDCHTLDATVRLFERDGAIKVTNLSGDRKGDMHPMSKSPVGQYIDHCKGPRKIAGISPENIYRRAA